MHVLNIAGYLFCPITDPRGARSPILTLCKQLNLKGTVILSPEGINCALAGRSEEVHSALGQIADLLAISSIPFKKSFSDSVPFDRMIVKVKPRLLPVDDQPFDPELSRATQLPARTLKQWLDEGKDLVLLDTRNDYEADIGTFVDAERCDISAFRKFKETVSERAEAWKDKTVVAFCTGGIRCEKAVPVMVKQLGLKNVFQLEGGILQYFEDVGSSHWTGDCFIFDKRVALDPALAPKPRPFCVRCGKPNDVTANSCRYCRVEFSAQG